MKTSVFLLALLGACAQVAQSQMKTGASLAWPGQPDLKAETDWIVSVKIQGGWEDQPTRQFTFAKTNVGYEAWTRALVKSSDAEGKLIARDDHFSPAACSALSAIGEAFARTRISPIPQDFMAPHAAIYRFWVATRYAEPRQFEFQVPNGSYWGDLGENPPALVAWVNDAQRSIAKCRK